MVAQVTRKADTLECEEYASRFDCDDAGLLSAIRGALMRHRVPQSEALPAAMVPVEPPARRAPNPSH
jgi:hypothetical protein